MQFSFCVFESEFIGAVDNPDDSISLFEVIPPVGSNGFLSSHVPDIELEVFILHGLDVETEGGWDLIDVFAIEFLDDCGFAGVVKSEY